MVNPKAMTSEEIYSLQNTYITGSHVLDAEERGSKTRATFHLPFPLFRQQENCCEIFVKNLKILKKNP